MRNALLFVACVAVFGCKKNSEKVEPAPVALPDAPAFESELAADLEKALVDRGKAYVPRTKHLDANGKPLFTNRLIKESSPYLLQHAHNPVNWYPWGDEAFEAAKKLDLPVLISIGYSTCHWCHVMEEESFEDIEIAKIINANYIAIKVDREERPDVDSVYMAALAAMGQEGGWPLNVWLTPDRKPFFGGTYFPPRKGVRGARIGFDEILLRAKDQFDNNREDLSKQADKVAEAIKRSNQPASAKVSVSGAEIIAAAGASYMSKFDRSFGGVLGVRSKFPSQFPIRFMLRYAETLSGKEKDDVQAAIALTLDQMRGGGIYDQVGGGFHRYSVDPRWVVPHFEKMLYDNGLLMLSYLEAYHALGKAEYAGVASDIAAYLEREMRSSEGGFYSATDADSISKDGHREEGAFFVWTPTELEATLSADEAKLATSIWGVTAKGNFEGKNNFRVETKGADALPEVLPIRDKLLAARAKRPAPLRDEKILASWNGLVLSGLAKASALLPTFVAPAPARSPVASYAELAKQNAEFLADKMIVDGRLRRAYKDGKAYGMAYAEDYAFVIAGMIELFEASGETRWLKQALDLQKTFDKHHLDKSGVYFTTANDGEKLLTREVSKRDSAMPSANSVAASNLTRLYELTTDPAFQEKADALIASFGDQLREAPASLSEMLVALDFRTGVAKEIVITGTEADGFGPLEATLRKVFVPRSVIVRKPAKPPADLAKLVPLSDAKEAIDDEPTAFVCEQTRCELPTGDPKVFEKQLRK